MTEIDPQALTRVTPKAAQNIVVPQTNSQQELRCLFSGRPHNNLRGFERGRILQYALSC